MTPFKTACLGAGYFAQFHLEAWARAEQAELVAIADQDLQKAGKAGAFGASAFANLDDMLATCEIDILDIIVPPTQHAAAIQTAIDHKIPHVICQNQAVSQALPKTRRDGLSTIVPAHLDRWSI